MTDQPVVNQTVKSTKRRRFETAHFYLVITDERLQKIADNGDVDAKREKVRKSIRPLPYIEELTKEDALAEKRQIVNEALGYDEAGVAIVQAVAQ